MAENAGARFFEGLRVTADHLRHTQDRLWEAIGDLRLALGRGKIAWGLRAEITGSSVRLHPGVAFNSDGVRLAVDTETTIPLPGGDGPFLIRLTPINEDRVSLQMGGVPTYVTLRAEATVIDQAGAPDAPETMDIGGVELQPVEPEAPPTELTVVQDPTLFIAAGHHGHSGQFVQDSVGRWYFDGPVIPELQILGEQIAEIDSMMADFDIRLGPLEELPARLAALEEDAVRQADLVVLSDQFAEMQPLLSILSDLQGLAAVATQLQSLASIEGVLQTLAGMVGDVQEIANILTRLGQIESAFDDLNRLAKELDARVTELENLDRTGPVTDGGSTGDSGTTGFDPEWPQVVGTNWPHGAVLRPDDAFEILSEVLIRLSIPLDSSSEKTAAMALQVWFEPMGSDNRISSIQQILTLPGSGQGNGDQIVWSTTAAVSDIGNLTKSGGRLLLRLHCGALMAADGRAYSASLQALTEAKSPPVPGGVLESWFFVQGG